MLVSRFKLSQIFVVVRRVLPFCLNVIVFTKGGGQWLDSIADCGAACVGLDWTVDLAGARRRVLDGARQAHRPDNRLIERGR